MAPRSASLSPSPALTPRPIPPRPHTRLINPRVRSSSSSSTSFSSSTFRPNGATTTTSADLHALLAHGVTVVRAARSAYLALPLVQRILVALCALFVFSVSILLLVFSHAVFGFLAPISARWRALPVGWIPVWLFVFATAFPPVIGYSFAASLTGFVFGFPGGWPIVASACVAGSLAAFVASRTIASTYVHRLVGRDARFLALGQVLRRDGLFMLTMIRFCPLPFSLSNGFLATIPSITPWSFAVSTALSSPKLLVHVFVGSRLAILAEHGDTMSDRARAINYLSMVVGSVVGIVVGFVVYRRTMARAAEIAYQTASSGNGGLAGLTGPPSPGQPSPLDYADIEAGLLDPDAAAALMDDHDSSLRDAPDAVYRDHGPAR